jgi:hypothetical protein
MRVGNPLELTKRIRKLKLKKKHGEKNLIGKTDMRQRKVRDASLKTRERKA